VQITITNPMELWVPALFLAVLFGIFLLFAKPIIRYMIKKIANDFMEKLLTEKYTQNLAEFLPSLKRYSILNAIELNLRAQSGKVLSRPLGTPKHFLSFENLMFVPKQMKRLPLHATAPVDMQVTLGPNAQKPFTIRIPIMISGMAYGLALSEEAKLALARAANALQTAICSGEGPTLPEEVEEAQKYILQISRWSWGWRADAHVAKASMLEVQMGQGADLGSVFFEAAELEGRAQELGGLEPGQPAEALPAPPGITKPEDWPKFMENLRQRAKGIPIGLKIMATNNLEEDLAIAVDLGFDVIMIDGAQGGSHATTPIKQDDFGIPTLNALVRAVRFLKNTRVSLIVAGGFFTPGQCLKALALGADAIYMATVPLFALAHSQAKKVTPWEPLTTIVYYDSPSKTMLDIDQAATDVVNALTSMTLEMEEALRALGKSSLKELSPDDLVALDALTAEVTGVKQVY
jgi:methylamine---glutamate N-methyltransferase subunit C